MATEVKSWKANDGSLHDTECDAVRRDLQLLIADSPCAENSPYAKIMLEWMIRQPEEIAAALTAYAEACPKPAYEATPMAADNVARTVEEIQAAGQAGKNFLKMQGFAHIRAFQENCSASDLADWAVYQRGIADHTPAEGELEGTD